MRNSQRFLVLLPCLLWSLGALAQDVPFQKRLGEIRTQLDLLSDTLAPGLKETATLSVSGLPLQTFLRSVAESHRLNIQIDPKLNVLVTNNFTNVPVKDLLYFVCQEYMLDIRFINTIMSFNLYQEPFVEPMAMAPKMVNIQYEPSAALLSFDLENDSLKKVTKEITRLTGKNLIVSGGPEMDGKMMRGYIQALPLESALDKLAFMNNLRLRKTRDDVYVLESDVVAPLNNIPGNVNAGRPPTTTNRSFNQSDIIVKDTLISLDVVNYPILDILNQVSNQLNKNFIVFSEVTGSTSAKVRNVSYQELLSFLFQGTNFTFKKKGGVYLIGQRTLEGFRGSEVVRLDFRTIDGIDKEIPAELGKDMEIKVLKELNSLVITGNQHRIDEIVSYLKLIDRPIPNILIEVIVADARKGFSLQTGIKAFLGGDSIPKTSGQVFPGVDMTLSSQSINNALSSLNSNGIVNLGRVTPNFYVTLKALEDNNNIQLRSTPKLSTMNGSKATLVIGRSVYYIEQTQNITGGVTPITTTSQRFNKVEANLSIAISPVVSGNEHITLDISAEFSDFIAPTIQNAPPGNTTRKFESKIRVKNEEMIILGGLEEISKSDNGSGVPGLSRVPILKRIFSSRTKSNSNNRLIVFIKPTLVY